MPVEMGWDVLALLGLAAFASGFVDAIAGGGGMITMPALLLAGLDPVAAVATNNAGAEASMEWVLAHMDDADFNEPMAQPGAPPPAPGGALHRIASHRIASHCVAVSRASHRIAFGPVALHRVPYRGPYRVSYRVSNRVSSVE